MFLLGSCPHGDTLPVGETAAWELELGGKDDFFESVPEDVNVLKIIVTGSSTRVRSLKSQVTWAQNSGSTTTKYIGVTPGKMYNFYVTNGLNPCTFNAYYSRSINKMTPDVEDY